jgi:hypothetical protein
VVISKKPTDGVTQQNESFSWYHLPNLIKRTTKLPYFKRKIMYWFITTENLDAKGYAEICDGNKALISYTNGCSLRISWTYQI